MWSPGRIILELAGGLIIAGGIFDLFTPHLPSNLAAICGDNDAVKKLTRELLRALGGSLVAIGAVTTYLAAAVRSEP